MKTWLLMPFHLVFFLYKSTLFYSHIYSGISSIVFTKTGQGFHLHSPCEFQRFTLSAKDLLEVKCKIDLPEGSRPLPIKEDDTIKEEVTEKVEEPVEQEKAIDVAASGDSAAIK